MRYATSETGPHRNLALVSELDRRPIGNSRMHYRYEVSILGWIQRHLTKHNGPPSRRPHVANIHIGRLCREVFTGATGG